MEYICKIADPRQLAGISAEAAKYNARPGQDPSNEPMSDDEFVAMELDRIVQDKLKQWANDEDLVTTTDIEKLRELALSAAGIRPSPVVQVKP